MWRYGVCPVWRSVYGNCGARWALGCCSNNQIRNLQTARSRLHRRRFLRPNTHFSAFFEIHKIYTLLHLWYPRWENHGKPTSRTAPNSKYAVFNSFFNFFFPKRWQSGVIKSISADLCVRRVCVQKVCRHGSSTADQPGRRGGSGRLIPNIEAPPLPSWKATIGHFSRRTWRCAGLILIKPSHLHVLP